MTAAERLTVALGARSYDIVVGDDLLARAMTYLAPLLHEDRVLVITDETVAKLHLPRLERALVTAGLAAPVLALPPGEESKSFAQLAQVIDWLLEQRVERQSLVLALGGGVIGDLAGFAAAIVLRGIGYVQLPTTLLAQVDSSVGGKTAISTPRGKNLVGAFHQPRLVLADITTLDTLPRRELLAGYAEVVKTALLGDAEFFGWLEGHGMHLLDGDAAMRRQAVLTCCRAKAAVVAADEREAGKRALLNLGHTFAHALEAETGYSSELLHGEAVAIGLGLAFDLSARLGYIELDSAARVRRHLAAVGLPSRLGALPGRTWSPAALIDHMRGDKKVEGGKVAFVLARAIGEAFLCRDVALDEVADLLDAASLP